MPTETSEVFLCLLSRHLTSQSEYVVILPLVASHDTVHGSAS